MGLFGLFKKKAASLPAPPKQEPKISNEGGNMAIAMVMLSQQKLPDLSKLSDFLKKHWNDRVQVSEFSSESEVSSCTVGGANIFVSFMPVPVPWSELEGPCATAWHWPEAESSLRNHKFHLIVVVTGSPLDEIGTAVLLTKVVAFTAMEVKADGIYWGSGTLVHSVESFADQAFGMSHEYLPLYLWIDFRIQAEEGNRHTLFTTGMTQFGLMEIEILNSASLPESMVDRAFNIAHYLLDKGPILRDGDTIGMTMEEKIKVKHLPSLWDPSRNVYRLELWAQP